MRESNLRRLKAELPAMFILGYTRKRLLWAPMRRMLNSDLIVLDYLCLLDDLTT